ncbi:MAG: PASTA domain-containing protein [Clostridia bacterium]|nr:PASTA domain-containing protein [Clostridia bacterium]
MAFASIKHKKRLTLLLVCAMLGFVVVIGRLFYVQIIKGDYYEELAYKQQTKDRTVEASRGTIYDSAGNILAISVSSNTLTIAPTNIPDENKASIAEEFAKILEMDADSILAKLNKKVSLVTIASNIEKEKAVKLSSYISQNEIKGAYLDESTTRAYPYGALLSHVLGFTGVDNQGLSGLEIEYEDELSGIPGKIVGSIDGGGNETPYDEEEYVEPQNGYDLVLTIDATVQSIVEKNIEKAVIENKADFGNCVIMNPFTGEILAMATYPDYDPNSPFEATNEEVVANWDEMTSSERNKYLNEMWRNKCVQDTYEPGSIFKVVTASAALEEGVSDADTKQYNCSSYMTVLGWDIKCWRYPRAHGTQCLREGIINSCNPVLMQVALKLGIRDFCKYLEALDLYSVTGIDLPGEASAQAYTPKNMTDLDLATTSFGQNISTTTLQNAVIYAAIANGGNLMQPYIVKEIKTPDGNIVKSNQPVIKKQVFSEETTEDMMSMLYDTVNTGTSKAAQATGYTIAGKTGTAEEDRTGDVYMASFAGVAPYNDPEIVIVVSIYNPTSSAGHMGGIVAAPVAGTIIEETLRYMDVDPNYSIEENTKEEMIVPNLIGMAYSKAKEELQKLNFKIASDVSLEADTIIKDQVPKAGASLTKGAYVRVYEDETKEKLTVTVPDVRGNSESYATSRIRNSGLNIRVIGSGNAVIQYPSAGETVTKGSIITVKFADTTDLH